MKFYSQEECLRKADQHSQMGSLAASDGDHKDAARQFALDKLWVQRAREGGWEYSPEEKEA